MTKDEAIEYIADVIYEGCKSCNCTKCKYAGNAQCQELLSAEVIYEFVKSEAL